MERNVAAEPARPAHSAAFFTDAPEELIRIHEPALSLCVWRREVAPELERFIDAVVLPLPTRRMVAAPPCRIDLAELLQDIPPTDDFRLFRNDLQGLVRLYAGLTHARRVQVKLESFCDNMCGRFHADRVGLRLICSYAGPGTEWLDEPDIDRSKLGPGLGGLPDEVTGLLLPGARVRRLERFAVGLLKGEHWPGNEGRGVVHRSPQIKGTELRRVLFRIEGA